MFDVIGYTVDIVVVLISGFIGILTPTKFKPQIKTSVKHLLAIEDTPEPKNKCYAVQVIKFSPNERIAGRASSKIPQPIQDEPAYETSLQAAEAIKHNEVF